MHTILLLTVSNVFMTLRLVGHLKGEDAPFSKAFGRRKDH